MSYTVHNFTAGDIIHAADLNEMDDQIAANEEASTVDTTLSQEGKPADAKAVGDEIDDLKADLDNLTSDLDNLTSDNAIKANMIDSGLISEISLPFSKTIGRYWYRSTSTQDGFDSSSDLLFNCTNKINVANLNGVIHIPFTPNLYTANNRQIVVMYYGTGSTYYREIDARNSAYPEVSLNDNETEVLIDLDIFDSKSMHLQKIGFNFATGTNFYIKVNAVCEKKKLDWLSISESDINHYENVPNYWLSTLDSIAEHVKSICIESNAVPIAFITDCHYDSAANVHGAILQYLDDKICFSAILNGGDFASESTNTVASHTEEMENAMAQFDKVQNKHLPTAGNHESIHAGMESIYPLEMTNYILHNHLSQVPDVHAGYEGNAYYYKNDGINKIRYIMLNAHQQYKTHYRVDGQLVEYTIGFGYSKDQLQWLSDDALKFNKDGWSVIFVSHIYTKDATHVNGSENETNTNNFSILFSIIEAALAKGSGSANTGNGEGESVSWNFTDNEDFDVIGYYCGHYHCDSAPFSNGSVMVIPTMSANLNVWPVPGVNVTKIEGTVTETAFDILCVDKVSKHVDLVRVGAGSNRSYYYGNT